MKETLESFIEQNRIDFDNANPPERVWEAVATALDNRRRKPVSTRRIGVLQQIAAAILLTCIAGLAMYHYGKRQAYNNYSRINPQLAAEQATYQQLVTRKRDSIALFVASDPALSDEFTKVFEQMESHYNGLKRELAKSPNQERTLEAMIRNLQMQIEVLSQQMEIINYVKKASKNTTKDEQI